MADLNPAYDINFCFPVTVLASEKIELTPFIPSVHASTFHNASLAHPEMYTHMGFGPFPTLASFTDLFLEPRRADPSKMLFAIIDKATQSLAGVIGLFNTSVENRTIELGPLLVLPAFQRTHVSSHSIGLVLHYALDPPSNERGGLGLRRIQWRASSVNLASLRTAERMGFVREATMIWGFTLKAGKAGNGREGPVGRGEDVGIDVAVLGLYWDEWRRAGRERVDAVMARVK